MEQNKTNEISQETKEEEMDLFCLLPHEIIVNIVLFLIDNYRELLKVNKSWMTTILSAFDSSFNKIENHIIYINMKNFIFLNSYLGYTVFKIENKTKFKLDRIIELELAVGPPNSTLIVTYQFKYFNDKSTYKCTYKIDISDNLSRSVWIHRSIANIAYNKKVCFYSMNIMPSCIGDVIQFAINLYSPKGLVDLSSIQFMHPEFIQSLSIDYMKFRTNLFDVDKTAKIVSDLSRICEVEDSVTQWLECDWIDFKQKCNLSILEDFFYIDSCLCAIIDGFVGKVQLIARKEGEILSKDFGIEINIKPKNAACFIEAKRSGLLIDRNSPIQLRIGDKLVIYITTTLN